MIASDPIGRGAAQRLARDELSKALYHQPQPLPARIIHYLGSLLSRLFSAAGSATPGGWWTLVALAALVVATVAVIAVRLGPLARSARTTGPAWDRDSRAMTAGELRDASAASAAGGDYSTAVLQRLRAIVASCEERGILSPDAGRTANEVAAQAGARFPGQRPDLIAAAQSFDQVRYGGGAGTRDGYERLCALDATLAAASPVAEPGPATATQAAGARMPA
ncbi:MAG TPA: DUF4129 domain-containing protein [Trebonia sp.]|nr:DUF4129 domain-containing protein [Trebonia sp.]